MITFILSLALIIALGLLISTFILIKILLKKIAVYEEWILDFKTDVIQTLEQMRAIDTRGTFITTIAGGEKGGFESDDELGIVFKEMLELIEKLNQRTQ
jgi:hypothetical protein